MKLIFILASVIYSFNGFAILLPNPKYVINEEQVKETLASPEQRRVGATKLLTEYYELYIAELQKLNHSDINPKINVVDGVRSFGDGTLSVSPQVGIRAIRQFLNTIMLRPAEFNSGPDTEITNFISQVTKLDQKLEGLDLDQKLEGLDYEADSIINKNSFQKIIYSVAPSKHQKFANIFLAQMFIIVVILSLRKAK